VLIAKIVKKVLQQYWRQSRGLSLGAKAIVLDSGNQVLLVRSADGAAWELPATHVKDGETVEEAMRRMLGSDFAITLEGAPSFIGLEPHAAAKPEGHIAIVAVRRWHRDAPSQTKPSLEARQFHVTALPADLAPDVAPWIARLVGRDAHPEG
jgi:ADP-ribose pyrophosphatase YjhB (NUDIX family)